MTIGKRSPPIAPKFVAYHARLIAKTVVGILMAAMCVTACMDHRMSESGDPQDPLEATDLVVVSPHLTLDEASFLIWLLEQELRDDPSDQKAKGALEAIKAKL